MSSHQHPHEHTHDHAHDHAGAHQHPHDRGAHAAASSLGALDDDELVALFSEVWNVRAKATHDLVAIIEEQIARKVHEELPKAATIVLYEDHSHDAPHAHIKEILDSAGVQLLAGTGDAWHDLPWAWSVDESIWDLYYLDPHGFAEVDGQRIRRIVIPSA